MMMMLFHLQLWIVLLPLFSSGAAQNGTPQLSCSGLVNENGVIDLCEVTLYYYCRCVVTESTRLKWSVNGVIKRDIFLFDTPFDLFHDPNGPLNILTQRIDLGDDDADTNFTSLLWFEYNYLENVTIECASDDSSSTKKFKRPGLTEVPTELDVSYLSQSEDSVTARYGWKYSGDLGSVSYFQVVVEVNNVTLCQKKVLKSIQEVTCLLPFKEGDNYTVTVAVVDNCNISGPPLTKMFTAGFDQLSRTDGGSCQCRGCLVWIAVSIGLLLLVAVLVMVIIVALCWCSKCRRDKVSPVELADSKNAALEASAALAKEKENNSALLADIKAAHSNEMERERERAREIAAALQKERQKSKVQYIKDHPAKSPPLNDISPLQSNQLLRISSSEASSPKTPASFSSGDSVNEPLLPKNN